MRQKLDAESTSTTVFVAPGFPVSVERNNSEKFWSDHKRHQTYQTCLAACDACGDMGGLGKRVTVLIVHVLVSTDILPRRATSEWSTHPQASMACPHHEGEQVQNPVAGNR